MHEVPVSSEVAAATFNQKMKEIGDNHIEKSPRKVWESFHDYCIMEIDCTSAGLIWMLEDAGYDERLQKCWDLTYTKYWYKSGVSSDTPYLATCTCRFVSSAADSYASFCIERDGSDGENIQDFLLLVKADLGFWEWINSLIPTEFSYYGGPQ